MRLKGSVPAFRKVCGTPAGTRSTYGPSTVNCRFPITYSTWPCRTMCDSSLSCICKGGPPPGWVSVRRNESVEAIIVAVHKVARLARDVIKTRHLLPLDHVI